MKNLLKRYPMLVLIVGLAALFLTQQKIIMPFVYDVIGSDLFLVESKDEGSQLPISTHMTELAFNYCNEYIKTKTKANQKVTFPNKPINAWSLGNYQFVINAEIIVSTDDKPGTNRKYACRINYNKGDDMNGIDLKDNWSIDGVSGIETI